MVRAFRLGIGALLLVVAGIAAIQGDWATAPIALLAGGLAAFGGVAIKDRASLEAARETGWRRMEPWGIPLFDIALVVMLVFAAVPVVLHALPPTYTPQ